MNTFARYLTIFVLVSLLAACGGAPAVQEPGTSGTELTAAEQWAKENGVGPYQPAEEDWEAIEAAAIKEGSVVVYANSSRFEKLLESWNALYPDIALEGGDTDDIAVKMSAEQEAGNVVGDVWFNSDGHLLYGEFMPNQWLWWYTPPGVVMEDVTPERPFALARRSVDVIGYNSEVHPDACPATNWWQFTEPELKGKFYLEDPISDSSTTAKITLIEQHARKQEWREGLRVQGLLAQIALAHVGDDAPLLQEVIELLALDDQEPRSLACVLQGLDEDRCRPLGHRAR